MTTDNPRSYLLPLEQNYRAHEDPEDGSHMTQYMKGQFQFYGIRSPLRKEIEKSFISEYGKPDIALLPKIIEYAYSKEQREYQYFAVELSIRMLKDLNEDFLSSIRFMILTRSWWDTVDRISSWLVGGLLKKHPKLLPVMDEWIQNDNFWLNRAAILYQLKYKANTDARRLFEYCAKCSGSSEFFIRKAIGWALREYSRTDPKAVQQFVHSHNLSGLSQREALRLIKKG